MVILALAWGFSGASIARTVASGLVLVCLLAATRFVVPTRCACRSCLTRIGYLGMTPAMLQRVVDTAARRAGFGPSRLRLGRRPALDAVYLVQREPSDTLIAGSYATTWEYNLACVIYHSADQPVAISAAGGELLASIAERANARCASSSRESGNHGESGPQPGAHIARGHHCGYRVAGPLSARVAELTVHFAQRLPIDVAASTAAASLA